MRKAVRTIGALVWLSATGITIAIMCQGMATQSWIVVSIGILGVVISSISLYLAREAFSERAVFAGLIAVGMWMVGACFVMPTEIGYWASTVTARAEKEADVQRQADARRLVLDETAKQLRDEKLNRPSSEVRAAIDTALAKSYSKGSLAVLTKNCADLESPYYRNCKEVLALRTELARAESHEKQSALIWDANTHLNVDTSSAHGAHDGSGWMAREFGGTVQDWSDRFLLITVLLLALARDWILFITWRKPVALQASIVGQRDVATSLLGKGSIPSVMKSSSRVVTLPVTSKRTPPEHIDLLREVLEDMPNGIVAFSDIEEGLGIVSLGHLTLSPKREKITEMLATLKIAPVKKGPRGARYINTIGREESVPLASVAA